ncbi:MAG: alpha/beta hydrolase [Nitrospinota bacterium]
MAREFGCPGLILESVFTSAKEMAGRMFPFLPVKYFIKTKFNSDEKIKNIACPKLFIHGNKDNIVPFKLGRKLFEAAPKPKEFYEIDGADHNDTYIIGGNEYFRVINQFLRKK